MKKNVLKKCRLTAVALSVFVGLVWCHTPINAVLGVVFLAAQGPSIPKVMSPKQVFEKKCSTQEKITSNNSSIIQATRLDNKFLLEAKHAGTTDIKISGNKKSKNHTITVAYKNINELPSTAQVGTKAYCTVIPKQSITCKSLTSEKNICRVAKKRQGTPFFYEIKFLKEGQIEFSDNITKKVVTITSRTEDTATHKKKNKISKAQHKTTKK